MISKSGHFARSLYTLLGAAAFVLGAGSAFAADPIKIGVIAEAQAIAGASIPQAAQLAADEINAAGGILGRKLEIIEYDPQFDNAKFQEFARRLIEKDKVEVIFGAATSASREAIRPIIDKDNAPRWTPGRLEDVTEASVGAFFQDRWSGKTHPLAEIEKSL